MTCTTMLIDLDDTLYPASSGLWALMRSRIDLYVSTRLHLSWDETRLVREQLFQKYGDQPT
jgi:putative hydrolase of the HAD superfamily